MINVELGLISGLAALSVSQVLRQLLPNLVSLVWQVGFYEIVPKKYKTLDWFSDPYSLLLVEQATIIFTKYTLLNQANLRGVVLSFGLIFYVFANFHVILVEEVWYQMNSLILIIFLSTKLTMYFNNISRGNGNPDVIIWALIHVSIVLIATEAAISAIK